MVSEYVGLSYGAKVYFQKNSLQSQLELLNSVERIRKYKKLRMRELVLKLKLKSRIKEALGEIRILEKFLPKAEYTGKEKEEEEKEMKLSEEVEKIKEKLNALLIDDF